MPSPTPVAKPLPALLVVLGVAMWQGMIGVWVKWSDWSPMAMVWARCVLTSLILLVYERGRASRARSYAPPSGLPSARMLWGGFLLAAHWVALFIGYRVAEVGPVVVALFTFPIMASIAEPLIVARRPERRQLGAGVLVLLGIAAMQLFASGTSSEGGSIGLGVTLGLCSAACLAARNIICRSLLAEQNAVTVMAGQAWIVAILLTPSLVQLESSWFAPKQLLLLLILGVGFTAIPHTLSVWALSRLSVATSGIVGSLQTVSTILLASWLLREPLQLGVTLGAAAVIGAVVWESSSHLRARRATTNH